MTHGLDDIQSDRTKDDNQDKDLGGLRAVFSEQTRAKTIDIFRLDQFDLFSGEFDRRVPMAEFLEPRIIIGLGERA